MSGPVSNTNSGQAETGENFPTEVRFVSEDATVPELPKCIGRYLVERLLGKGGFGLVYLANDVQLHRQVAIKVPHARRVARPEDAKPYLAEAQTVASLDHPNIVPVYDVGHTEEFPCFVVSRYIDGTTLAQMLRRYRYPWTDAARMMATLADALHYAHTRGLVHRDIKPGNILIDLSGKPYIVDFGLALRERESNEGHSYAGTPVYMSPEQARGEGHRVDGRSDIFSLGIVLYEMLTKTKPFQGNTTIQVLSQIATLDPRPPRQISDAIPKELERICLRALAKRATDRYTTARDFADDLRCVVGPIQEPGNWESPAVVLAGESALSEPATRYLEPERAATAAPTNPEFRIVPKGLRAFDEHDADFFLDLLPGPRDRNGLPDSIRFWKTHIEETDSESTFTVGLLYGPSGCGKSSLVKAGLLPRLSQKVIPVYVEAAPIETELRLLNGLRKHCPGMSATLTLKQSLTALRRGQAGVPPETKVLIVLDQFEQWLHGRKEEAEDELVEALRQCDGSHVQCLILIRDDFWMATIRLMRSLEIRLSEGLNSMAVDLFDVDHSRKVLGEFGRAFGRLPIRDDVPDAQTAAFLDRAVASLAQEGKVICVHLALFAEMMKARPWTLESLDATGGAEGIVVNFLEESFSASTAPPEHRYHQKAARATLKSLLPASGSDLKGYMRSAAELLEASGYAGRPGDFDELLSILDSEIRLITPTEPAATAGEGPAPVSGAVEQKYYQLTHDYLVPSLRDWLTRKQKETLRGRAELRLVERAALWNARPENRHLPSWWEYLAIRALVPPHNCNASQKKMLATARRVHAIRWGSRLALLLLVGAAVGHLLATERRQNQLRSVATALDTLQNSRGPIVSNAIRDLQLLPRDMVLSELGSRYASAATPARKLGLAYALAEFGQVDASFLGTQIQRTTAEEIENFVAAFSRAREKSLQAIGPLAAGCDKSRDWRYKTSLAVVSLHLDDDRIAADMCRIDDRPDPIQRTFFIDEFSRRHGDLTRLATVCQTRTDPALRSAMCLVIGSIPQERWIDEERLAWKPLLVDWYQSGSTNVVHSAAGWALRQLEITRPELSWPAQVAGTGNRFEAAPGLTMLKIRAGTFVRRDEGSQSIDQTVRLTDDFWLGACEVTQRTWKEVMATTPWSGHPDIEPGADFPATYVSWEDASQFCRKLTVRERQAGRLPQGWEYALPTEAQWEYACRAGTTTEFANGNDEEFLRRYASVHTGRATLCGSKLPNGWGLFDMHGNAWEWCREWHGNYSEELELEDPEGASEGSERVVRGGSWYFDSPFSRSANRRGKRVPDSTDADLGFRVALVFNP